MSRGKSGLRRRGAFTLVELLVVISIIGMLIALLLPAVQQAREAGRRTTCLNNMKNCMFAVLNYEGQRKTYPGYCDTLTGIQYSGSGTASTNYVLPVSWLVQVLPLLERTAEYNLWRNELQTGNAGMPWPPQIYMDILNCPSSPPTLTTGNTPNAYVVNSGMLDTPGGNSGTTGLPADFAANGVFFNKFNAVAVAASAGGTAPTLADPSKVSAPAVAQYSAVPQAMLSNNGGPLISINQEYITTHDGSSLTLMMSENNNAVSVAYTGAGTLGWGSAGFSNGSGSWGNLAAGSNSSLPYAGLEPTNCFVWWPDANPNSQMKINAPLTTTGSTTINYQYYLHPASNHPTAVNVAFCDGHARNISQDIDYLIFSLLMTPYGQLCNTPGSTGIDTNGTGTSSFASTYYPSGANNYTLLRTKLIDDSQVQ
ncbi:MAG TPA: DUF1559 domain-containing protein [Pirellulales bacterium]|nr:DUF1559 domain-containing protein [Pirellulales bacterium]